MGKVIVNAGVRTLTYDNASAKVLSTGTLVISDEMGLPELVLPKGQWRSYTRTIEAQHVDDQAERLEDAIGMAKRICKILLECCERHELSRLVSDLNSRRS